METPAALFILPVVFAAGIDLPLTLLVLLLSVDTGSSLAMGGGMGLLRGGALVLLGILYALELGAEAKPPWALFWHNTQLILRPPGILLLAMVLLEGEPLPTLLLVGAAASVVGAFTHVMSWGSKLHLHLTRERRISPLTYALAEDTGVLLLLVLAQENPRVAFYLSAGSLVVLLLVGGSRHHLARFGSSLFVHRSLGWLFPPRWKDTEELPGWIRRWGGEEGFLSLRGQRAGGKDVPGLRGFRDGWLLEGDSSLFFATRIHAGGHLVPLESLEPGETGAASLVQEYRGEVPGGGKSALFLHHGTFGVKTS